jgi:hypothetical protein
MKCRACWSDKAYLREDRSWKANFLSFLGLLPVKCHHCFHKTWIPWFMTWGQQSTPPIISAAANDQPPGRIAAQSVRRAA